MLPSPLPTLEWPTILLVEDEVLIRLMIADELRSAGFYVLEASNADEAWEILESALPVDLLFTDIQMPGEMDGIALASRARARNPDLKLIITSGRHLEAGVDAHIGAGEFVSKPYSLRALLAKIESLLGRTPDDEQET